MIEVRIIIANGSSQNPSYHIACACIRRQLPVSNRKADGSYMISYYPEGNTLLIIPGFIYFIYYPACFSNSTGKYIRIVIGYLSLYHSHQSLQAHPGIYMFSW